MCILHNKWSSYFHVSTHWSRPDTKSDDEKERKRVRETDETKRRNVGGLSRCHGANEEVQNIQTHLQYTESHTAEIRRSICRLMYVYICLDTKETQGGMRRHGVVPASTWNRDKEKRRHNIVPRQEFTAFCRTFLSFFLWFWKPNQSLGILQTIPDRCPPTCDCKTNTWSNRGTGGKKRHNMTLRGTDMKK